jgi:hypothetical protein
MLNTCVVQLHEYGGMLGYALYADCMTSSKLPQLRMFDCFW